MSFKPGVLVVCSAAAALMVREAKAETLPAHPVSVEALGSFGLNDSNATPGTADRLDAYGWGVGARIAYAWRTHLTLGLSAVHHFGYSRRLTGNAYPDFLGFPRTATGVASRAHIDPVLLEGGYELRVSPFVARPYVGVGVVDFSTLNEATDGTSTFAFGSSSRKAAWASGLLATVDLAPRLFAGIDLRYVVVLTGNNAFGIVPLAGSPNAFEAGLSFGFRL